MTMKSMLQSVFIAAVICMALTAVATVSLGIDVSANAAALINVVY